MATHSSILTRGIPWTEKPRGYSPQGCKESDTTEVTEHRTDRTRGRESLMLCPVPCARSRGLPGESAGGGDAAPGGGPLVFHHHYLPCPMPALSPLHPWPGTLPPLPFTNPACRTRLRFSTTIQHLRKGELP